MNITQTPQMGCTCGFLLEGKEPKPLKGVPVVYPDRPGVNRNIYPKDELIKAIDYYKKLIQVDPTYRYCLAKHPKDTDEEWIGLIAGVVDDIYFNEKTGRVEMDVTLLPTIWGHFIAWALENGYNIGTSLRGDADKEPGTYKLGDKVINVWIRKNLKLEGIDFVLYPSFITTQAEKTHIRESRVPFERVVESYLKDLVFDDGVDMRELMESMLNPSHRIEENSRRFKMNKDRVSVELEVLAARKEKAEAELFKLNSQIDTLTEKKTELDHQIAELKQKLEQLTEEVNKKTSILEELHRFEKMKEELEKEVLALEQKRKETEEYLRVLEKKAASVKVRFGGKTFDEDNPPKIRVVPVSEKVSNVTWGDVDKDKLRKLVWLTKDEKLAKQVFGLVEGMDDWRQLKYPVYQPMVSKEEGYDIDLVLNRDGLATAVAFMFGRPGWALSARQKKHLIKFLYEKYKELQKEGIAEVPPKLAQAAKKAGILEKIEIKNDTIAPIVEFAILAGLLDIEGAEEIQEKAEIEISEEALGILADALVKMLGGSPVFEQIDVEALPKGDEVLVKILKKADGTPTSFAEKYEITGTEEFKPKFLNKLFDALTNDRYGEALTMIKEAIYAFLDGVLDNSEDAKYVLDPVFDFFIGILTEFKEGEGEVTGTEEEGKGEEESGGEETASTTTESVREKIQINGKEDEMLYEKLKELIEAKFENLSVETPEDLVAAIEKICDDYAEVFSQLQQIEFERVKEQKITELLEAGVDKEIIEDEFEGIETVDELEVIADKLLKVVKKVQESRKIGNPLDLRKGVSVPGATKSDSKDPFTKLMNSI